MRDFLIFGLSNYTDPQTSRTSAYLWALSEPPGYELWRLVREEEQFTPDPVGGDGQVFVLARRFDSSVILGVDAMTGNISWQSSPLPPGEILAYAAGVLVVSLPEVGTLTAFHPARARAPLWIYETGGSWRGRPAIVDGRLYTLRLERADRRARRAFLVALDVATGRELWRLATGRWKRDASPDVGDGLLCLGRADRYVLGVEAASGRIRWIYAPPQKVDRVNVGALDCRVSGTRVYAWDDLGHLFALDAASGKLVWTYEFPREIAELLVEGRVVYAWVDDGMLYALR